MKLLHISLLVFLLLAVAVDGAKKKKNHRDRDEGLSSRQQTEDELPSARKEDDPVVRGKENNRRKEKEDKEEKPLKKAEDESSSEEEEEKKKEDNKTTIAPSRMRRHQYNIVDDSSSDVVDDDDDEFKQKEINPHANKPDHTYYYRLMRAEWLKELDQILSDDDEVARSGRSRRSENTMHRAKELDEIPLSKHSHIEENPTRHRPKRAENTLKKAKEMDQIPMNPSHSEHTPKNRKRRAENSHAQTGEVILGRAQELNGGEKLDLVIDENAGSRPDYRKKSRGRRNGEMTTLEKANELNGGERTEIARDDTAKRPDYRKNSRTQRAIENLGNAKRRRRNLKKDDSSSEEDTLKKAQELNDGVQKPVDNLPSQSQMPDEKVKAHRRRAVRHLNVIKVAQPGNHMTSSEERDTEEWKKENEQDYDDGNNE